MTLTRSSEFDDVTEVLTDEVKRLLVFESYVWTRTCSIAICTFEKTTSVDQSAVQTMNQ